MTPVQVEFKHLHGTKGKVSFFPPLSVMFPSDFDHFIYGCIRNTYFPQKMRAEWSLCILVCCHGLTFFLVFCSEGWFFSYLNTY